MLRSVAKMEDDVYRDADVKYDFDYDREERRYHTEIKRERPDDYETEDAVTAAKRLVFDGLEVDPVEERPPVKVEREDVDDAIVKPISLNVKEELLDAETINEIVRAREIG